jgi:Mg/Co/Ni transporter MgtE
VDGDSIVGILTRRDLLAALARQEQRSPVADVMRRDFHVADAAEMIEVALQRMRDHDCHTMPVVRRGHLIGLVTMDNVGEFLSVQAALGRHAVRRPHIPTEA